jgi:signal transduction histidine kinase
VFRALSFLVGLLMLGVMPFLLWSGRSVLGRWRAGLMALGFVTMFGASMNDVLIVAGTLPPDQTSFILLGFSTVLLAYALVCAEYVMRTLNQAETSNEMLEARMREKSRELEHSYALLRESERASARAQERARFNREIHDGLGAQLITALRGVERDALNKAQVVQTLQEGLDELRLLMDSSDLGRSLHGALVSWRNRWDARLQAIGLQLQWSVSDDLEALELGSDATLQLMRVLQESVTNTIKHASAHHISVRAWRAMGTQPTLELEIQDDGQGLPDQAGRPNGRGLRHMAQRAERLGARLVVDNAPPPQRGTRVRLSLPWPEGDFRSSDTAPLTT